jgi:hypothetical protein
MTSTMIPTGRAPSGTRIYHGDDRNTPETRHTDRWVGGNAVHHIGGRQTEEGPCPPGRMARWRLLTSPRPGSLPSGPGVGFEGQAPSRCTGPRQGDLPLSRTSRIGTAEALLSKASDNCSGRLTRRCSTADQAESKVSRSR